MGEERQDAHSTPPGRKLSVSAAASELGISAEAVRSRLKRGTLRGVKEGSTVYVLLGERSHAQTHPDSAQTTTEQQAGRDQTDLVESLEDQVSYLRRQLDAERDARQRADTIIAQLSAANAEQARAIRQLEGPERGQESPQESAEVVPRGDDDRPAAEGQEAGTRRPWWRRVFGG